MTKKDFTIEGSEALKEAFIKESGLTDNHSNLLFSDYLTSHRGGKRGFDSCPSKNDIHFKLPQQFNEGLEYIKYYFKEEPEYQVGEYVIASCLNGLYIGRYKTDITLTDWSYIKRSSDGYEFTNGGEFDGIKRKAVEEEILNHLQKEFTNRTGIKIGSEVTVINDKTIYINGQKALSEGWKGVFKIRSFKLIKNKLFIDLFSNWNEGQVYHSVENIKLKEKELVGYEIIQDFPHLDPKFIVGFKMYPTVFCGHKEVILYEMAARYPKFFKPIYE